MLAAVVLISKTVKECGKFSSFTIYEHQSLPAVDPWIVSTLTP
jgi:hypothetical protein